MRRLSRGWLLLVVAAVGAFAAGTGVSLLFSDSDSTPPNRVLRPMPAAAAAWGGIVLTPANWLGPGQTRR